MADFRVGTTIRAGVVRKVIEDLVLVEPLTSDSSYRGDWLWWKATELLRLNDGALDAGPCGLCHEKYWCEIDDVFSPQVGLAVWNRLQESAAAATLAALFVKVEPGVEGPEVEKREKPMEKEKVKGLLEEFQGAVVEGAKVGAAASVASQATELVKQAAGSHWPRVCDTQVGLLVTPILLCLALAFGVQYIPGIPKADAIRRICLLAAKGSAVVAAKIVADRWGTQIRALAVQLLGLGAAEGLDVPAARVDP